MLGNSRHFSNTLKQDTKNNPWKHDHDQRSNRSGRKHAGVVKEIPQAPPTALLPCYPQPIQRTPNRFEDSGNKKYQKSGPAPEKKYPVLDATLRLFELIRTSSHVPSVGLYSMQEARTATNKGARRHGEISKETKRNNQAWESITNHNPDVTR